MGSMNDRKPTSWQRTLFEWMASLIGALVVVAFVYAFLFRVVTVSGVSMDRTLHNGDNLIIVTRLYTLERGDIVVIERQGDEPLIKRVIALAGDVVDIDAQTGTVLLNGKPLAEAYTRDGVTPPFSFTGPYTVPEGYVFAMGDNRCESLDSRDLGPFSVDAVLGEAVFRISPMDKIGPLNEE